MDGRNRAGDTTHRCAGGHEHNRAIDLGHRWGAAEDYTSTSTIHRELLRTLGD